MFRFASPYFLFLLVPVLGTGLARMMKKQTRPMRVAGLAGLGEIPKSLAARASGIMPWLKVLALGLMILALARPQSGEQKINVMTEGVNIILALDLSESMRALDFKHEGKIVTRLEAVKSVVSEFIMKRDGDRLGLVVFGSNAFTQLPLTRDYNTIAFMLDRLKIGAAGPRTAIGDALGISLKRLEDVPSKSNIIILLTDGESNAGELSWQEGAEIAAGKNVKVYTIGVGSRGEAPFLVDGLFGKQYVYRQVSMDLEALKAIAEKTGGSFFRAGDIQSLEKIYDMIDSLEKTKVEVDKWVEYRELYSWFLTAGVLVFLVHMVLNETRFIRIP
ncbi:vWA domain-containing protein [Desulfospira joergensenii]|uniref:vWA domain-containing protein n=1 Tax=Desulfospira joergensenii TaxID=53329 RepID=UPI0003B75721|nr:VWA domain-containing protein [Desulfospira joergensenii]